jgi:hypothetical protein
MAPVGQPKAGRGGISGKKVLVIENKVFSLL